MKAGENRVGSLAENDLVIAVSGVSRHHAVIHWDEGGLWIEDLRSKNGTLVNRSRVRKAALNPGDEVSIGPVALRLEAIDPDDATVAIQLQPDTTGRLKQATRWSPTQTPTDADTTVPARWLGVFDRLVEAANAPAGPHASEALEVLITGLGASGAALIDVDRQRGSVVRYGAGAFRLDEIIEDRLRGLLQDAVAGAGPTIESRAKRPGDSQPGHSRPRSGPGSGSSGNPAAAKVSGSPPSRGRRTEESVTSTSCGTVLLFDGEEPIALSTSLGHSAVLRALVVFGDFPWRQAATSFLPIALRALLRAIGEEPVAAPRSRRPMPDLSFPKDYVAGHSEAIVGVYRQLRHLLLGDIPVLITGETGVGKEFIARILHASSPRAAGPLEAVNCAAIPTDLLEVELFGIEGGVATGVTRRDGRMVLARGGIIFLDEIGDMSQALQAKLLRALQEKEVHPVGARHPVPVDVRVVAATNTNLQERIAEGRFRSDLYYRIAGYTLYVPALRERRDDIPLLVEHFMRRFAAEVGKDLRGISAKTLRALVAAPWPGNVRELEHEVRRLVYLCHAGQPITSEMLSPTVLVPAAPSAPNGTLPDGDLELARHQTELERRFITLALARAKGNKAQAARLLGISRYGLRLKMQRLGLHG